MRFPDDVEIIRPRGTDGYGNPGRSFEDPEILPRKGFEIQRGESLLMPPDSGIAEGDRVRLRGKTFKATPTEIRSPSKTVLYTVDLEEVEGL